MKFIGVTLNCDQTIRRFAIEAFPLTANGPYQVHDQPAAKPDQITRIQIRQLLKRIPLIPRVLRFLKMIWREIRHILAASRMVRGFDCVLVSGGGALDEFWGGPWGHPWNLFKWSALSWIHRVPFVFLSVGKCSLERPASRLFVKIALKLACYRSYRDPDSKSAVQALIHAPDDPVIPDLAFSYPLPLIRALPSELSCVGRLVVGFSPISYCDPRIWPLKDERRYRLYIERLSEVVKWLLGQGHQLVFFATDSPDLETINDLLAAIANYPIAPDAIITLPGPVEQTIDGHLNGIAGMDLIVASRLHAVILSHLAAVPVLAISFDPKVGAHMVSVNQMDYCLDINTFTLELFIERFENLKGVRLSEQARLRAAADGFRRQLDIQYDQIFGCETGLQSASPPKLDAGSFAVQPTA